MIEVSLVVLVVLSSLLFGAVYSWTMAVVAFVAIITFIYFMWHLNDNPVDFANGKGIIVAALLLLAYPLIQLIPLPVSVINLIHPKFRELITISPGISPVFHSVSPYPFATEMEICRLFIYLTVFFLASFGIRDEEGVLRVIRALIVFGFILAIFAIVQHATWNGKIYWFKKPIHENAMPFGPYVNKSHFAGFIGMIIPLALGISLWSGRIEKKLIFAFLGIIMAIALFFSLSRGGIVSFLAGMIVFSVLILAKGMSKKRLIPIAVFALILGAYLLFLGVSPIVTRFAQSEATIQQRLAAWMGTLLAFKDYAVLGSGFGTFQYIFKIYQPDGLYLYWDYAHNDYLELLLELGIVGIVVVAFFLLVVLRTIVRTEWHGRELYLRAAFLSSISTIAVHSTVDFNFHIPSNALLFFLILGLGVSLSRTKMSTS